MLNDIKKYFFDSLVESAKTYLEKLDPESGRFTENGGWAVTLQDPVLAYAYLYTTDRKSNPFYKDQKTYDVILKGVQALRDFQYPDGQLEFIKTDGSKWGPIYMPWTFYHWLETYAIMKDHLPEDKKADWEKGLMPAFLSFAESDDTYLHNITLWNCMSLHRAGIIFGKDEWKKHADKMFVLAVKNQHSDGYWEEHQGPTVAYNYIYTHALGLYKFHGGQVDVLSALKKSAAFHQVFTYPDGSSVETIDGRVKYHKSEKITWGTMGWGTMGLTGLLATRAGIKYIHNYLDRYSRDTISLPHTTSLLLMLDNISEDFVDEYEGYPDFANDKLELIHGKGSIQRKAGKQIVLSSYITPLQDTRWSLDRQSFISVWDEKSRLLTGSGNSKYQPGYSSFVICGIDKKVISYTPFNGRHLSAGEIELSYYGAKCSIKTEILDDGTVCMTFGAQLSDDSLSWYINLPLKPKFNNTTADIKEYSEDSKNIIEFQEVKFEFEDNYTLTSPSFPFNPYTIDGSSGMDEASAVLSIYPCSYIDHLSTDKLTAADKNYRQTKAASRSLNCRSQIKVCIKAVKNRLL